MLCSSVYPQPELGKQPNDKLIVLEDTNQDGKADKSFVFLDGLNQPTGFALGHGGVYLGQGKDLLHFKDTNGDHKADHKELLFTGFGTGDTHQNINSFYWTPGGELLFCQGLHCFSRVETPWGIRRLDEHGSWRLRPLRRELHSFARTSGGGNPWGYAFGKWGEPFIKANSPGVSELLPSMVHTDYKLSYWGGEMGIGSTRIKSMIIERVDSEHLPAGLQGDFLIAGYYARNIARLRPKVAGAGHKADRLEPLLTSSHQAFRPVDIKTGPDGALYVADWFNPIIGHYQASFRHPQRDKMHGRIWKITAKDKKLLPAVRLHELKIDELCAKLCDANSWVRQQAKLRLMNLSKETVVPAIQEWVQGLADQDAELEYKLFLAIGVLESHEVVDEVLLRRLMQASDYRARAYAARVVGRWQDRLKDPLSLLSQLAEDEHPRVRLEVVVASSYVPYSQSVAIAAKAIRGTSDRFIDYAFKKVSHALKEHWKPALIQGELHFDKDQDRLALLSLVDDRDVVIMVRKSLKDSKLKSNVRVKLLHLLAKLGNAQDLVDVLKASKENPSLLRQVRQAVRVRKVKKVAGVDALLKELLRSSDQLVQVEAIHLCSLWKIVAVSKEIERMVMDARQAEKVRIAAVQALVHFEGEGVKRCLLSLLESQAPVSVQLAGVESLLQHDVSSGVYQAIILLSRHPKQVDAVMELLVRKKGALRQMAAQLAKRPINKEAARAIQMKLNASGVSSDPLMKALRDILGEKHAVAQKYSKVYIDTLTKEVHASGDAKNGKRVFLQASLSCVACHKVKGMKEAVGVLGPDLSAVGSGLSTEMIIESVLWPNREIKEGYASTTIETRQGKVVAGTIVQLGKDMISVKEASTGKLVKLPLKDIQKRTDGKSTMPEGLVSSLSRKELRDLIKYLAELKN